MLRRDSNTTGSSKQVSFLITSSYAATTRIKYQAAADRFTHWCDMYGRRTNTFRRLDRCLSDYLHDLYNAGRGKGEATAAVYGVNMLVPGTKYHIPRTLQCLKGYHRLQPVRQRPPIPWTVAVVIAVYMASQLQLRTAVGVLLAFDCYLRVGELVALRREDVAIGDDPRLGTNEWYRIHLHLRRTKTGNNKGVELKDDGVKILLTYLYYTTRPGHTLLGISADTFRRRLRHACEALHLSSEYTPHCLRHGGATRDYLAGMPITDVMVRGRWANTKSAQHYIQTGRQLMMLQHVPNNVAEAARVAVMDVPMAVILSALSQITT